MTKDLFMPQDDDQGMKIVIMMRKLLKAIRYCYLYFAGYCSKYMLSYAMKQPYQAI